MPKRTVVNKRGGKVTFFVRRDRKAYHHQGKEVTGITLDAFKVAIDKNNDGTWTCSICGMTTISGANMVRHVARAHTILTEIEKYFSELD